MRRMSTAAATHAARARLAGLFSKQPAISDLVEMQTIASVQRLMEQIPTRPAPQALSEGSEYRQWLDTFRSSQGLVDAAAQLDKDTYAAFFQGAMAQLKTKEDEALRAAPAVGVMAEDALEQPDAVAFVEAAKLKLARHMCAQAASAFELLDKDKDGKVQVAQLDRLLRVVEQGNSPEWLRSQFEVFDADADDVVTEDESRQILESIASAQKAVVSELFASHVSNMPKKHMKLVAKGLTEEDWKVKIPEKIRCVFHYAYKVEEAELPPGQKRPAPKVDWEAFRESQEAELPELHQLMGVYAKGVYDYRFELLQRQRDRRSTRNKGLALALAIAVGDFIATIV